MRTPLVSECQRCHAGIHTHTRTYRAAHRRVEHDLEHRVAPAPLVQEEELLSSVLTLLGVINVAALVPDPFALQGSPPATIKTYLRRQPGRCQGRQGL